MNAMRFDLTDLQLFVHILDSGTLTAAAGLSHMTLASASERVRGRVQRRVLWMLIERSRVPCALDAVRAEVASHDVRWWLEPVLETGRLA